MAFYNLRKKVKLVSQDLIDNSENYAFYDDINKTEATLRQNIQEIYDLHPALLNTISKKTLSPLSASASASASAFASASASSASSSSSSSSSSTTSSIDGFVKRGGPKYCPGYGLHKIHLCAPKTKFFPCGVDKVERCLECHEQAMREYGGRIQIAKVKKQSTSEKSSEPVRFKLKC
jgi:hypothetical protein